MVCVSGSLPEGVDHDAFTRWMTELRTHCPCIIFDSSREALVAGLKAAPWLVKPNRRELEIWAGRKLPGLQDVIGAAHELREQRQRVDRGSFHWQQYAARPVDVHPAASEWRSVAAMPDTPAHLTSATPDADGPDPLAQSAVGRACS